MSKLARIAELEKELQQLKAEVEAATAPPKETIFKPNYALWPAVRVRNIMKEIHAPCRGFDKNIRVLAHKTGTSPEILLQTNPIIVGLRLGISRERLRQMIPYC